MDRTDGAPAVMFLAEKTDFEASKSCTSISGKLARSILGGVVGFQVSPQPPGACRLSVVW